MNTIYPKFVSPSTAAEIFGVTTQTLRRWAKTGKINFIKTPGGHTRYDIARFMPAAAEKPASKPRKVKLPKIDIEAAKPAEVAPAPQPAVVAAPVVAKLDPAALRARIEGLAGM